MADLSDELGEGCWFCDACGHLIYAPSKTDRWNHVLDEHRDLLLSGRLVMVERSSR